MGDRLETGGGAFALPKPILEMRSRARQRLMVLLGDQTLVEQYLATWGPVLDPERIQLCAGATPRRDPVMSRLALCPVCRQTVKLFDVAPGTQRLEVNAYQLPIAAAGREDYLGANPLAYEITVCTGCLFASSEKRDFLPLTGKVASKGGIALTGPDREGLKVERPRRSALLHGADAAELFGCPRDLGAALVGYMLACQVGEFGSRAWIDGAAPRLVVDRLRVATIWSILGYSAEARSAIERSIPDAHTAIDLEKGASRLHNVVHMAYLGLAASAELRQARDVGVFQSVMHDVASRTHESPEIAAVVKRWAELAGRLGAPTCGIW